MFIYAGAGNLKNTTKVNKFPLPPAKYYTPVPNYMGRTIESWGTMPPLKYNKRVVVIKGMGGWKSKLSLTVGVEQKTRGRGIFECGKENLVHEIC